MEPDLLQLLRLAEEHPSLAKEHVLDEVRRMAAQRLWPRLTEAQRAYACGLLHGSLPASLEWHAMPAQARTIVSSGVLRWAAACQSSERAATSYAKSNAQPPQAEPGPTTPVGC